MRLKEITLSFEDYQLDIKEAKNAGAQEFEREMASAAESIARYRADPRSLAPEAQRHLNHLEGIFGTLIARIRMLDR